MRATESEWGFSEMTYEKIDDGAYKVTSDPDNMAPEFFAKYGGWLQSDDTYLLPAEGVAKLREFQSKCSLKIT